MLPWSHHIFLNCWSCNLQYLNMLSWRGCKLPYFIYLNSFDWIAVAVIDREDRNTIHPTQTAGPVMLSLSPEHKWLWHNPDSHLLRYSNCCATWDQQMYCFNEMMNQVFNQGCRLTGESNMFDSHLSSVEIQNLHSC